ncbi:MAG TPA: ABC transporter ATP-binding protein [Actinomycetota bacterium]
MAAVPDPHPTSNGDPLIRSTGLTKTYGEVTAVRDLDLAVGRGEVYGFLGPNGAGKTTTLRMLLGLIHPTSGSAEVLGRPPGDPEGLVRVGAMVEEPAFYPYLTGRDNLRVITRYAGLSEDGIDEALGTVELLPRADSKFKTYSQGMKQRLGIAAALLKGPDLLILDEPTNGLDPAGMVEMRTLIRHLGTGERTVLLSSHLLAEVQQICDRVGVISKGRLVFEGSVDELRGRAAVAIRAEPLDLARRRAEEVLGPGRVEVRDGELVVDAEPAEVPALNRELVLADVQVSELRPASRSLEEAFLQLTGEGGDDDEG